MVKIIVQGADARVVEYDNVRSILPFKSALHAQMRNFFWHPARRKYGWCVSGDTLIDVPRDLKKYPFGIPIRDLVGEKPWLYSFSRKKKRMVLTKATSVVKTGKNVSVVKIRFSTGDRCGRRPRYLPPLELKLTSEHLVLLTNGKYKQAKNLKPGDRVRAFSRKAWSDYAIIDMNDGTSELEHRYVWGVINGRTPTSKEDVHHKDENGLNNTPKNLEALLKSEHRSLHYGTRKTPLWWRDEWYEHPRGMLGKRLSESTRKKMTASRIATYEKKNGRRLWIDRDLLYKLYIKKRLTAPEVGQRLNTSGPVIRRWLQHYDIPVRSLTETRRLLAERNNTERNNTERNNTDPNNHIVLSVEPAGKTDVYDIEVPKYHNFVANGVVVHNSGKIKFYRTVKGDVVFNSALLPMVKKWCKKHNERIIVKRRESDIEPSNPTPDMLRGITLRTDQLECIEEFLSKKTGIIQAGTGAGKTEIFTGAAKCLGVKTLVLVSTLDLLNQTRTRLKERLKKPIGVITSTVWSPKNVTVASVQTLYSIISRASTAKDSKGKKLGLLEMNKRRQRLRKLERYLDEVKFVIGDEVQFAKSKSWNSVLDRCLSAEYRLGVSARPFSMPDLPPLGSNKLKADDLGIVVCFGPVIKKITSSSLVKKNILARPHIMLFPVQEPVGDHLPYREARHDLLIHNKYRNKLIVDAVKQFVDSKLLTLVIAGFSVKHGTILTNMIKKVVPEGVFYLNGGTEADVREQIRRVAAKGKKIKVIITTVIWDLGVDVPNIGGLVMAAGGKEPRRTIQRLGRSMRSKKKGEANLAHVVDFIDYQNPYLLRHSYARLKEYLDEEAYIVELAKKSFHNGKVKKMVSSRNNKIKKAA